MHFVLTRPGLSVERFLVVFLAGKYKSRLGFLGEAYLLLG